MKTSKVRDKFNIFDVFEKVCLENHSRNFSVVRFLM